MKSGEALLLVASTPEEPERAAEMTKENRSKEFMEKFVDR